MDELITDMEPIIHDLRDLTVAIEYMSGGTGVLGREIPAHVGLSISTIASESLGKINLLHGAWQILFGRFCGADADPMAARPEGEAAASPLGASIIRLDVRQSTRPPDPAGVGGGIGPVPPPD